MDLRLVDPLGDRVGPSPKDYAAIGLYLRALREHRGLTLGDLADTTRIRRSYLQGIEEGDRSALPARPFAIGYVRAYAQALGVDGDAAVARFKREMPDIDEPFRDPVGVRHEKKPRSPLIIAFVALVVSGVVLWNVVQRAMIQEDRAPASLPSADSSAAPPAPPNTTVAVSAATPAPAAQNLPEPYKVPGLDAPAPEMKGGVPVMQTASDAAAAGPAADMPVLFQPQGTVFGAPASSTAVVVLQARKPASLIVRGGGGAVYFARQLAAGEAYRAPQGQGLTAEVVDPAAFVLYISGQNKGVLASLQTVLDKLAVPPPSADKTPGSAAPVAAGQGAPVTAAAAAIIHANTLPRRPPPPRPPTHSAVDRPASPPKAQPAPDGPQVGATAADHDPPAPG
jgi:cytoskeletal protein RodZ